MDSHKLSPFTHAILPWKKSWEQNSEIQNWILDLEIQNFQNRKKKKQKSLEVVSKILLVLFNNFWFLKLILDWKLRFTMWSTAY